MSKGNVLYFAPSRPTLSYTMGLIIHHGAIFAVQRILKTANINVKKSAVYKNAYGDM